MKIVKRILLGINIVFIVVALGIFLLLWMSDDTLYFDGGRGYVNENGELIWENGEFASGYTGNYTLCERFGFHKSYYMAFILYGGLLSYICWFTYDYS